jgi:cytochrome c biogenesis protein CcmG, thiol:disulfide interchange protein DsbE
MQLTRLMLATVAVGFLLLPACKGSRSAARAPKNLAFNLPDLSGKTVDTSQFQGRVLLVDFWATWCKPCEHSFPFYSTLQKELEGQGFTILAISVDERDEDVAEFLERVPVSFRVLRDPEGSVARKIDRAIDTMPTAVLIGRDGAVRMVHAGFVSGDEEMLKHAVKEALAEAAPVADAPGDAPRSAAETDSSTVSAP